MKKAIGSASARSITVTDNAMPTVRTVTMRKVGSLNSSLKLVRLTVFTRFPVKSFVVYSEVSSSETNEPR